ncbi:hypothetical protein LCI18_012873 [Fusarium solani-melongenae]|uniref:Uncharacterized protein n=1 Tax=Fusarium solani subsp. cucurbitae TaxID=2747967 RepID=A0ACD3ZLH4_FUSSC|nr:hypothetical protein LCI18_012873 [Fusarium solani-melongenae]
MSQPSRRIEMLSGQLSNESPVAALLRKTNNDAVFTLAIRTALTKSRKWYLKDTQLEGLLVPLLQDAPFVMRAAGLAAGFPATTAMSTASRWCSSGLLAGEAVAQKVASGSIDIGIAIGAESMSTNPDTGPPSFPPGFMAQPVIKDLTEPIPWTAENVARDFGITRERQDEYAAASVNKAEAAQKGGFTADEIVPILTAWKDPKTGELRQVVVERDDGIRGNASQITDGAAAVLVMRREMTERLRQPVLGKYVQSTVVGLDPRIMGIGPAYAIPKLLSKVGITKDDVDIFEINEAFASMASRRAATKGYGKTFIDPLGHPLGCTGARQIITALSELRRTGGRIAVTSMCVGTVSPPEPFV